MPDNLPEHNITNHCAGCLVTAKCPAVPPSLVLVSEFALLEEVDHHLQAAEVLLGLPGIVSVTPAFPLDEEHVHTLQHKRVKFNTRLTAGLVGSGKKWF